VPGRFRLLSDENIPGPLIEALKQRGWDVVRTIDVFGQRSVDDFAEAFDALAAKEDAFASCIEYLNIRS
jgi:hypothetical protein